MQHTETPAGRLARLRAASGFGTGAGLARAAGMPEATYRAYENGARRLSPRAAKLLAPHLGLGWRDLLPDPDAALGGEPPAGVAEADLTLPMRDFAAGCVRTGRYASTGEVLRAAMRLLMGVEAACSTRTVTDALSHPFP